MTLPRQRVLRDGQATTLTLLNRATDFFHNETSILTEGGPKRLVILKRPVWST